MSERKPSTDAVSVPVDPWKPSTGAGWARESAGYAPIDRQAGASNIHSDPSPKNFPSRSHIDQLWNRAMDDAIRMNEFYTRYRFYELVREEVLASTFPASYKHQAYGVWRDGHGETHIGVIPDEVQR